MSVLATDAFTGTGALSGNWTVLLGSASRVTDQAVLTDTGAGQIIASYTGITTPNNQYCQGVIGSIVDTVSDQGAGLILRCSDSSNLYLLQGNTHETRIYKKVAGTFTQLGSDGPAIAAGDVLYFEIQGTQLIAKKNTSTICGSPTDSALSSGNTGLWGAPASGITVAMDTFEVGDFAGAAVAKNLLLLGCGS